MAYLCILNIFKFRNSNQQQISNRSDALNVKSSIIQLLRSVVTFRNAAIAVKAIEVMNVQTKEIQLNICVVTVGRITVQTINLVKAILKQRIKSWLADLIMDIKNNIKRIDAINNDNSKKSKRLQAKKPIDNHFLEVELWNLPFLIHQILPFVSLPY